MILVIGSHASGKKEYVKSLGYTEEQFGNRIEDKTPVLYGLHELVAQDPEQFKANMESIEAADLKGDKSPEEVASLYLKQYLEKEVIVCDEVGSGVIPMRWQDRMAREQTGRLCNLLARYAERVVRIVCGIPTVIK